MVFLTSALSAYFRIHKPRVDAFWRKRRIFKISSHFYGRRRNCYSIAIRAVHRALANSTKSRALKKEDMKNLWITRISAASEENGLPYKMLHEGLIMSDVYLNKKVLADLAVWEPRTFASLTRLAWSRAKDDGFQGVNDLGDPPEGVFTRNMLK